MNRTASISLDDDELAFIEDQISKGRYQTAGEIVRVALRLLEERDSRADALRAALIEGEESGPARAFDFDAFLEHKRAQRR